ncbi:hypothetical protein [Hydrogenophaga sp. MI9]|uniref:hypothetical protein n=1 Tax=Hydrogenophaga sp. MI9 TaxID=3453719 RepID=UPI003EF065DB
MIAFLLPAFLLGCSSKPSSSDVKEALSKQLVSQCKFAKISDVNLDEVIQPELSNSNKVVVKYSYELGVKVDGGYVDDLRRWEKSQEVKKQIGELYDKPGESKVLLDKWIHRERLPSNASNEEYEAEEVESRRLERLVEFERYERVKKFVGSTDGMFALGDDFGPPPAIKLIEKIKEPDFPTECIDYSQSTPFGLLHSTLRREGPVNAVNQYINGVSVKIAAEGVMLKTDAGWTFR